MLVVFGQSIELELHRDVLRLAAAMQRHAEPFVRNLHPAYSSLLVTFDPRTISHAELERILRERLRALHEIELPPPRSVEVPVCYDADLGPDAQEVAALHGLDVETVARLHCGPEYRVYFLGFSPGFAYMGGLPSQLATPRLATPRTRVPAGSVAIGGAQTGVYPIASPGGWRIIGRVPLRIFRPEEPQQPLLQMGDRVRFRRIARPEFERLAGGNAT